MDYKRVNLMYITVTDIYMTVTNVYMSVILVDTLINIYVIYDGCSQPPDKPELIQYVRKIDLKSNLFGRLMSGNI